MPDFEATIWARRVRPALSRCYAVPEADLRLEDCFVARYDAGRQAALAPHRDATPLSFNVLLSDARDFDGGATVFSDADDEVLPTADAGDAVAHPGQLLHGGRETTRGTRLVAVGFVGVAGADAAASAAHGRDLGRAATLKRARDRLTGPLAGAFRHVTSDAAREKRRRAADASFPGAVTNQDAFSLCAAWSGRVPALSAGDPRRRRDPSPWNVHAASAPPPRLQGMSTRHPRRRRDPLRAALIRVWTDRGIGSRTGSTRRTASRRRPPPVAPSRSRRRRRIARSPRPRRF